MISIHCKSGHNCIDTKDEIPPPLPLQKGGIPLFGKGRWEKIEIFPLTLPSPARGEGKHVEIVKKFPPPRRGRAGVGVILGNFSHLQKRG
jgi:hypothetical protein